MRDLSQNTLEDPHLWKYYDGTQSIKAQLLFLLVLQTVKDSKKSEMTHLLLDFFPVTVNYLQQRYIHNTA